MDQKCYYCPTMVPPYGPYCLECYKLVCHECFDKYIDYHLLLDHHLMCMECLGFKTLEELEKYKEKYPKRGQGTFLGEDVWPIDKEDYEKFKI